MIVINKLREYLTVVNIRKFVKIHQIFVVAMYPFTLKIGDPHVKTTY